MSTGIIQDKTIRKTFTNTFERGHLLFDKVEISWSNNTFSDLSVIDDIVFGIRYATKVCIVLKEICLARRIVEELTWVKKYCKISFIAKTESIKANLCKQFDSIQVNSEISCNAVYVEKDGQGNSYLIDDGYYRLNSNNVYEHYFCSKKINHTEQVVFDLIETASTVYLFEPKEKSVTNATSLIEYCNKKSIPFNIVIPKQNYNLELYASFCKVKADLLISSSITDRIILYVDKNRYYKIVFIEGIILSIEIDGKTFGSFFSTKLYRLSKLPSVLATIKTNGKFILAGKDFEEIFIKESTVIPNIIEATSFDDYMSETFNVGFYDKHNDYYDYAKVEYVTTLLPPLLPKSAKIDVRYAILHKTAREIVSLYNDCQEKLRDGIEALFHNNWKGSYLEGLNYQIDTCIKYLDISQGRDLDQVVSLDIMRSIKATSENFVNQAINQTIELFASSSSGEYDKKTKRIKDEIGQKREQLRENEEKLKDENENHVRAQRLIDNLKDEIIVLEKLLAKQADNIGGLLQSDKAEYIKRMERFLSRTDGIVSNARSNSDSDSFSRVIGGTVDSTATRMFENKVFLYSKSLMMLIAKIISFCDELVKMDLPVSGVLFNSDKTQYLTIKKWEQVKNAIKEADKYKAKLVVER